MHRSIYSFLLLFLLFDAFLALNFVSNTLGSHMVLQRAPQRARIWGWVNANQSITLRMTGTSITFTTQTKPSEDGSWEILLPATPAGGPYNIAIMANNPVISHELEDVLFGDVYICSGQSNMAMSVQGVFNATEEIQKANNYPNIRVFNAALRTANTEQSELLNVSEAWAVASATTIGQGLWEYFSATCWFFGKNTYDATQVFCVVLIDLNRNEVPLGLVASTWGGTYIQAWIPANHSDLSNCSDSAPLSRFEIQTAADENPNQPNVLWNAMMIISGFLWYQGESNVGHAKYYACAFPAMITAWRNSFEASRSTTSHSDRGQADTPFYFVQLSTWKTSTDGSLSDLRLSQMSALKLPHTGMAAAMDLGDIQSPIWDVHPRNKQEVGRRLSLLALHDIYHQKIVSTGPIPTSFKRIQYKNKEITVIVSFRPDSIPGGIVLKNATCPTDAPQCGAVAEISMDGQWLPVTDREIYGRSVVFRVMASKMGTVEAIRYNYANYPLCVVYNKANLPMTPFVHHF
ncbi:hypothetical protein PROFUN_00088 [Planoprotostelium fungivorum]|uniref:Sialate O-acetylesterase domain-containing protein n=1 Tax=Planoprotostelium fungivorum TaxID=1890364 RepID=A0A2P6P0L3_9EUKA|nr:hypothetical protein PROFUN_00088 [Planoprotostelium fungivorum]